MTHRFVARAVCSLPHHQRTLSNQTVAAAVSHHLIFHTPDQGQGTFHRFRIYGWRLEILRAGFVTDAPLPALVANNIC